MQTKSSLLLSSLFAASWLTATSQAAIVWSEDFEDDIIGSAPVSNFPGGAGTTDWSIGTATGASTTVANSGSSKALYQTDTDVNATTATVLTSQFGPSAPSVPFALSTTTNILRLSFDFRVDSLLSANSTVGPRVILRSGNATAGNGFVLGFARAGSDLNGDGTTNDLNFYAAPQAAGSSNASGASTGGTYIGLQSGNWVDGFNFGGYSSTTATDNNTDGHFYRFVVSYDFNTGVVVGTATNVDNPSQTTTFSITMNANIAFTATDAALIFASGSNSGTSNIVASNTYFDNILVEAIPEPSAALLACGGLTALIGRRRRNQD